MKRDIMTSVSDKQWAAITGTKAISRAAQARAYADERRTLIAALGWAPEGPTADDRYVATTAELKASLAGR